jgi:hypothetical protein
MFKTKNDLSEATRVKVVELLFFGRGSGQGEKVVVAAGEAAPQFTSTPYRKPSDHVQ